jgi:hypothetical protein
MFIRVRKRRLKGMASGNIKHGLYLWGRAPASCSTSFDLVRAVRINGNPRHVFVLGLGSQKNTDGDNELRQPGKVRTREGHVCIHCYSFAQCTDPFGRWTNRVLNGQK